MKEAVRSTLRIAGALEWQPESREFRRDMSILYPAQFFKWGNEGPAGPALHLVLSLKDPCVPQLALTLHVAHMSVGAASTQFECGEKHCAQKVWWCCCCSSQGSFWNLSRSTCVQQLQSAPCMLLLKCPRLKAMRHPWEIKKPLLAVQRKGSRRERLPHAAALTFWGWGSGACRREWGTWC